MQESVETKTSASGDYSNVFFVDADIEPRNESYLYGIADKSPLFYENNANLKKAGTIWEGHDQVNNFVRTYWDCFVNHGSAVFSASDLWLLISLNFSKYCALNPLAIQPYINPQFSGEKKVLTIIENGDGNETDWKVRINKMVQEVIKESYQPEFIQGLQNDLKCATPIEQTACNISILKSVEYFYKYQFMSWCGFKSIRMIGDKDDWIHLRNKVANLRKYHLEPDASADSSSSASNNNNDVKIPTINSNDIKIPKDTINLRENIQLNKNSDNWGEYIDRVVGIIDKFIESFEKPDLAFFRDMMHDSKEYGFYGDDTDSVSGWILKLFYGFNDSYIVSEVPVLLASVNALYDPIGYGDYQPIQIKSGFSGYQKLTDFWTYNFDYRPITFCSVIKSE